MSGEIVVGACYLDVRDGEIVRVVGPEEDMLGFPANVLKAGEGAGRAAYFGARVWRDRDALAERVPDPTPAVIDDAEPLAGEMTLRQFFSWAVAQDVDGRPVIRVSRDARGWRVALSVCPPHVSDVPRTTESIAIDPQDAFTALMSKVGQ